MAGTGSLASLSIAHRNAASVLPEPVGAITRVWSPAPIDCQACAWAWVGAAKAAVNQALVASLKPGSPPVLAGPVLTRPGPVADIPPYCLVLPTVWPGQAGPAQQPSLAGSAQQPQRLGQRQRPLVALGHDRDGRGHGMARSGSSKAMETSSAGSCKRSIRYETSAGSVSAWNPCAQPAGT